MSATRSRSADPVAAIDEHLGEPGNGAGRTGSLEPFGDRMVRDDHRQHLGGAHAELLGNDRLQLGRHVVDIADAGQGRAAGAGKHLVGEIREGRHDQGWHTGQGLYRLLHLHAEDQMGGEEPTHPRFPDPGKVLLPQIAVHFRHGQQCRRVKDIRKFRQGIAFAASSAPPYGRR